MWRLEHRHDALAAEPTRVTTRRASILYWSDHTARVVHGTGIQRVVRNLARALGDWIVPIGWDSVRRGPRVLSEAEQHALGITPRVSALRQADWMLVPEIPATALAEGADPLAMGRALGLRTAVIVHDLIPMRMPQHYPPEVVAFYRDCFRRFAGADLLVATTRHVAEHLRLFLVAEGLPAPPIALMPLAGEFVDVPRTASRPVTEEPLRLLSVSRFEPRKNLPRLLSAIEAARGRGHDIRLTLAGRRGGFPDHEAEIDAALARMPFATAPLSVEDRDLPALHAQHHATIYPSIEEGFGLPVLESLWFATPCLCHDASAMAEVAPGGGTLLVDMTDETAIADIVLRLASDDTLLARLATETAARPLRRWADCAADLARAFDETSSVRILRG